MSAQITKFLFVIAVLALLWDGAADGAMVELSLTASKDATIQRDPDVNYPGPQANANLGRSGKTGTSTRGSGETYYTLIGFDSSSFEDIGPANVVSAELNLKIFSAHWPWDKNLVQLNEVRRLTHDWVDGTGGDPGSDPYSDPTGGVNWLTYDGVNAWPGGLVRVEIQAIRWLGSRFPTPMNIG